MKKLLISLIACLCVGTIALGSSACGGMDTNSTSESSSSIKDSSLDESSSIEDSSLDDDSSIEDSSLDDTSSPDYEIEDVIGSEGLQYTLSEDGTYYIASGIGTCTETDIVIASKYKDLLVKTIGETAFRICATLTSVKIPNSVTTIEPSAFSECTSLTNVEIPNSVTTIGNSAFWRCTSLTTLRIPKSVTKISDSILGNCSKLTNIIVDENNPAYCSLDGNLYNKDQTKLMQYTIGKTATEFTIPDTVKRVFRAS